MQQQLLLKRRPREQRGAAAGGDDERGFARGAADVDRRARAGGAARGDGSRGGNRRREERERAAAAPPLADVDRPPRAVAAQHRRVVAVARGDGRDLEITVRLQRAFDRGQHLVRLAERDVAVSRHLPLLRRRRGEHEQSHRPSSARRRSRERDRSNRSVRRRRFNKPERRFRRAHREVHEPRRRRRAAAAAAARLRVSIRAFDDQLPAVRRALEKVELAVRAPDGGDDAAGRRRDRRDRGHGGRARQRRGAELSERAAVRVASRHGHDAPGGGAARARHEQRAVLRRSRHVHDRAFAAVRVVLRAALRRGAALELARRLRQRPREDDVPARHPRGRSLRVHPAVRLVRSACDGGRVDGEERGRRRGVREGAGSTRGEIRATREARGGWMDVFERVQGERAHPTAGPPPRAGGGCTARATSRAMSHRSRVARATRRNAAGCGRSSPRVRRGIRTVLRRSIDASA